jgi:hypothetical protein
MIAQRNFSMRILFLALVASCTTFAQEKTDSSSFSIPPSLVTISASNAARVFLDGDSVGITPFTIQWKSGKHFIKLVSEAEVNNWISEPILDTISIQPNTPQTFRYAFTKRILLNSTPSGAQVFVHDSLVGTTPLMVRTPFTSFTFRKAGFEDQQISLDEPANAHVQLKKVWQSGADSSIFKASEDTHSSWRLYISGATTVIAGAASAYFKVKADNTYSDYVATGNPSQLSETNRLDTAASIALAATQVSLGLFTYFLLSE